MAGWAMGPTLLKRVITEKKVLWIAAVDHFSILEPPLITFSIYSEARSILPLCSSNMDILVRTT
jgi:hypothetical protein